MERGRGERVSCGECVLKGGGRVIILRERADYLDAFFSEPLLSFQPPSADRCKHTNGQMVAAVTSPEL